MSNHHLLDEAGFPMLAEAAAAGAGHDAGPGQNQAGQGSNRGSGRTGDLDGRALAAAYDIALMWGEDRSQFVAKIQIAVRKAMDWAIESNSAAL